jgi:uncharacterized protein (TIGR00730 family)
MNINGKKVNSEPITLHEVEKELNKRLSVIDKEFREGFSLIKHQPKSITFFGSARTPEDDPEYIASRKLAQKLSQLGFTIISGGGPGIMEAANRGAFEVGGRSVGLNIKLPHEQVINPYTTHSMQFYYFFIRKVMLSFSAEAYIFFPGGYGTLDEFFEILTLVQTGKIERVPIILFGKEYWTKLFDFVKSTMLDKYRAISDEDLSFVYITDEENEAIEIVKSTPVRNGIRLHFSEKQK